MVKLGIDLKEHIPAKFSIIVLFIERDFIWMQENSSEMNKYIYAFDYIIIFENIDIGYRCVMNCGLFATNKWYYPKVSSLNCCTSLSAIYATYT